MRLSDALEVAIGLSFIFVVASVVLASIQEAIESVVKQRGWQMFQGITEMLHDAQLAKAPGFAKNGEDLALALYRHPSISGLMKGSVDTEGFRKNLPSYLPSRAVALAFMDQAMAGKFVLHPPPGASFPPANALPAVQRLRLLVQSIQNTQLRTAMLNAIDTSTGEFDSVRKNLETWFDGAMDRVSGRYKRYSQRILFALGFVFAVALNINTLTIANALFHAPALRDALGQSQALKTAISTCSSTAPATPPAGQPGATAPTPPTQAADFSCDTSKLIGVMAAADLPIGWSDTSRSALLQPVNDVSAKDWGQRLGWAIGWFEILGGWLLTAFAVSLGAPFWFGVLNRLMMLRNALRPGDTTEGATYTPPPQGAPSPQTSSGDPPPTAHCPPSYDAIDHAVYVGPPPTGDQRQFEDDEGLPVRGVPANPPPLLPPPAQPAGAGP